MDNDKKYAWKKLPPKDGEPSVKKVHTNGVSKTYYWCPYHHQWTVHSPKECKRLTPGKVKKNHKDKRIVKRQNFKEKKQAFIQAKAAYEACMTGLQMMMMKQATLIMMRTLTSQFYVIHHKTAMFLDMEGVRSGDQYHLMQPNSTY